MTKKTLTLSIDKKVYDKLQKFKKRITSRYNKIFSVKNGLL